MTKEGLDKYRLALLWLGIIWFCFLLPFQVEILPTALGLMIFGLGWILRIDWKASLLAALKNPFFIIPSLLFAYTGLGLLYSSNLSEAERVWVVKIPLMAWPLAWAVLDRKFELNKETILKSFLWGTALSCLLLLSVASYRFIEGNNEAFFYHELMIWPMLPGHYLGMYLSFAAALASHFAILKWIEGNQKTALLYLLPILLFIVMLALAAIRIQWLVFGILQWIVAKHHLPQMPQIKKLLWIGGIITLLILSSSPEFRRRLIETGDEIRVLVWNDLEGKQTNARFFLWKNSYAVIQKNFVFGTGTGDGNDALQKELQSEDAYFWNGERSYSITEKNYNYHSEYLQEFASHGILGFLLFLFLLLGPFFLSKKLSLAARLFLIVTICSFTTESMLERQAGIFFFAFFYALLITDQWRLNKTTTSTTSARVEITRRDLDLLLLHSPKSQRRVR